MNRINYSKTYFNRVIRKSNLKIIFLIFILYFIAACSSENENTVTTPEPDPPPQYETGKNYYTTEVDGDTREYYVHVPANYNPDNSTPVVFMLHGTTGNGEMFYNISGWKELGEVENILTVYPSSWSYCITQDGITKTTTKWNIYPGAFEFCPGEMPRNDIKFLRQIVAEIKQRFNVDNRRMYLVGFSNGGAMAGRIAVEMSDVFAAVVESAGTLPYFTTFTPIRRLPVLFQLGNSDDIWIGSSSFDIPLGLFDSLLTTIYRFRGIIQTHSTTFGFDSTYTLSGDTNTVMIATFNASPPDPTREFKMALIKGLEHKYPNGTNHPVKGAEINWNWLKQYTLP